MRHPSYYDKSKSFLHKIDAYFADGVRMVIQLDPQRQKAVVYRPGVQPLYLTLEDTLEGGDVLPGFKVALKTLFE
jgi:Uma2 family endonuclease